jgi:hypothetical protein
MAKKQVYLKAQNAWWLGLFVTVNVAAYASVAVARELTGASVENFWHRFSLERGLFAVSFALATVILNGFLGDLGKARVVFWRWSNPLPGSRAFSVVVPTDPRIDAARLRSRVGPFPRRPNDQNAAWYRLYRAHADKVTVLEAHRAYLLTRDMTGLAALFAIGFSVGAFVAVSGWRLPTVYSAALAAQYLIVATSARNYGNRFVANVLVEESQA